MSFEAQVLEQLAAIREDNARRFAELEQHDRECYGNGQPGWKAKHEERLIALETERNESKGARHLGGWLWGGALSIGTVIAEFLIHRK